MCAMQPELQGMLPVERGEFTTLQRSAYRWPDRLKQAAAVCNALTLINRNHVVGDVPEAEAFKAVEAQFLVSSVTPHLHQSARRMIVCLQSRNLFITHQELPF